MVGIAACTTTRDRNVLLLQDRVTKLKPLSTWPRQACQLETTLTQPAVTRYRGLFPGDKSLDKLPWQYTWYARESGCDIRAVKSSPAVKNQQSFLNTAVCLLLQAYWVNSPFDEMKVTPDQLQDREEDIHILSSADPELGVFLSKTDLNIETRTKSHGALLVSYASNGGEVLPTRLQQTLGNTVFVLDELEWASEPVGGRRMLKSFWIFAGQDKSFRHSQVVIRDCRPD